MADERIYGFDKEDVRRVIDSTEWIESQPRYPRGRRGRQDPRGKQVVNIHVTSTTGTSIGAATVYPGVLTTWSGGTWTDTTITCWLFATDGSVPQTNRYAAYQVSTDNSGVPIYEAMDTFTPPPAGTVTLVTDVTCSAGTLTVTKQTFKLMDLQLLSQGSY